MKEGVTMQRNTLITALMLIVVMLAACGQKADDTGKTELMDGFIYTSLDEAKAASLESGKQMVLDFYFET